MQGLKGHMHWQEQTGDTTKSDVIGVKPLGVNK